MTIFDSIAKPFVAAGKWTGKAFTSGSTDKKIGKGFKNGYIGIMKWWFGGGKV